MSGLPPGTTQDRTIPEYGLKSLTLPGDKAKHMKSRQVSGPDHHRWWNVVCTHYPRNQGEVNALASQCISMQGEIQADFVGIESDAHGVHLVHFLIRGETVNAECYCKNWYRLLRTRDVGCLVSVLSCCTIMLGHTWLDGQHISCRELFNHPPYWQIKWTDVPSGRIKWSLWE